MFKLTRAGLAAILAAILGLPSVSWAADAEADQAIRRLIEVGWSASPRARTAADATLAEIAPLIKGDQRALEAWTLILIHQRRYEEASKRVDQWIAKDEDDWQALRARIWLSTILKAYPSAIASTERLASKMASVDDEATEQSEQLDELAMFLGRIYGFYAGPARASVNQEERRAAEGRILSQLGERRSELFETARDQVLQKHLELTDAKDDESEKTRERKMAEREKTLIEIAKEREQMAARSAELKENRDKLRAELQGELDELQKQDRPLQQQYTQLDAQAAGVNRELAGINVQIDRLEFNADREKDPVLRNRFLRDAEQLRLVGSRLSGDLSALQREAAAIQAERAQLVVKQQEAQRNYGGQISAIDCEFQAMSKREKRLAADEVRANKPISGTTGQVLALGAQATALTTYDMLPLESAKEAILAELK